MKVRYLFIFIISLFISNDIKADSINPNYSVSDTISLSEAVVTGTRIQKSREEITVPVTIIKREIVENSGETSLLPVLSQQVPGLFVTSRGVSGYGTSTGAAGGINLRGFSGSSGRVLILIDGHPQYAGIYGHPVADSYISSDAERIEVSRGPASILYGSNAMGGAINIITRKTDGKNGNNVHLRAMGGSYGSQKYMLTDNFHKDKFSAFIGANYDKTDGHRENSQFKSIDGFLKLGYKFNSNWKVSSNVSITNFESHNPGEVQKPMLDGWVDVTRGMAGFSIENEHEKTSGAFNFYYNWGIHDINDGYTAGGSPQPYLFHSTDYVGGTNFYQSLNLFNNNSITVGFDTKLYGGNAFRNPVTEIYADHIKLHELAGYLFTQQDVGKFTLDAGIRLEHHKLYGNEWIPQAGLAYKMSHSTNFKFSVSKGFRTPNLRELYMYASANEDLLPENSVGYDFSYIQKLLNNRMSLELNLFYVEGDNIIQVVMVDGRPQNQNVGKFANKGVELSASYYILDNLKLSANYSYLYMDTPITGSPKDKFFADITYNPGKFSFSLNTQLIGDLYLSTGNAPILTDYTLVNARMSYKPTKQIELFVKGDNLLSKSYETMLNFVMPGFTVMGGVTLDL